MQVYKEEKSKMIQNDPKIIYNSQPYSEADRSSNARSELKTIINNYKLQKGRAANGGDEGKRKGIKEKKQKKIKKEKMMMTLYYVDIYSSSMFKV